MQKGGYQILDFQDVYLDADDVYLIAGLYEKIKNTRKVILVSGLNINDRLYRDFFATPMEKQHSATDFRFVITTPYGYDIEIHDNDTIYLYEY